MAFRQSKVGSRRPGAIFQRGYRDGDIAIHHATVTSGTQPPTRGFRDLGPSPLRFGSAVRTLSAGRRRTDRQITKNTHYWVFRYDIQRPYFAASMRCIVLEGQAVFAEVLGSMLSSLGDVELVLATHEMREAHANDFTSG
jgi:hypothetical protein